MVELENSKIEGFYNISLQGIKEYSEVSFNPLSMEIIVWRKQNTCNCYPMPEKYGYKEFIKTMKWDSEFARTLYVQKEKIIKRINSKLKSGKWN